MAAHRFASEAYVILLKLALNKSESVSEEISERKRKETKAKRGKCPVS